MSKFNSQILVVIAGVFIMAGKFVIGNDIERKAKKLGEQFFDHHNNISWQCYTNTMARVIEAEPKYKNLAATLKDLSDVSDNRWLIGISVATVVAKLAPYGSSIPSYLLGPFSKHPLVEVLALLKKRIEFKGNPCPYDKQAEFNAL